MAELFDAVLSRRSLVKSGVAAGAVVATPFSFEFAAAQDKKIACPLHVLWAQNGAMGRMYDVMSIWKERGANVTGAPMPGGHNFQETHPQETLAQLLPFLAG